MRAITVSRYRTQYPYVENVCDYGYRRRTYADTSKNEDTWYRMLWHYDAEDRGTPADNPESIRWMVIWKVFCTFVRNRDGNLNVPYLYEDNGDVVMNWNWLDNGWNDSNPALRFANLFISRPRPVAWASFVW